RGAWIKAKTPPFNPEFAVGFERGGDNFSSKEEKSTTFGISQKLELFGKRGRRKAAARHRWDGAKARLRRAERVLAVEVSQSFRRMLTLGQREAVFKEIAAFDKEMRDAARVQFKEERISQLSLDLIELEYNQFNIEYLEAQSERRQESYSFLRLLGRNPDDEIELEAGVDLKPLVLDVKHLEKLALSHRSDYAAGGFEIKANTAELALARKERLPNPTIGLEIGSESSVIEGDDFVGTASVVGGIERVDQKDKRIGLQFSLPLPLFNRNQGEIAEAEAHVQLSRRSQEDLRNKIATDVRKGVARLQSAQAAVALYQTVEPRLNKDLVLVRKAFGDGQIAIEVYLAQKDRFVNGKLDYLKSLERLASAHSELEKVVGHSLEQAL
ncbi:MAG: hypothetical protein COB53_11330, partial [Elusimicrobia bacterium]